MYPPPGYWGLAPASLCVEVVDREISPERAGVQGGTKPLFTAAGFARTRAFAGGNHRFQYHKPTLEKFFVTAQSYEDGPNSADYKDRRMRMDEIKIEVANLMAKHQLDALVYPHQKCLVLPIGATFQKDRNGIIAALAGFPAIEVPAGFSTPTTDSPIGVPVGMEFLGRAWAEPELIGLAFGFEQATHLRKPPVSTPALAASQSAKSY
jgi:Asp-tRNA(Asn)/Glu-tRNA(Gln) amidotransferase A subunit family amidase